MEVGWDRNAFIRNARNALIRNLWKECNSLTAAEIRSDGSRTVCGLNNIPWPYNVITTIYIWREFRAFIFMMHSIGQLPSISIGYIYIWLLDIRVSLWLFFSWVGLKDCLITCYGWQCAYLSHQNNTRVNCCIYSTRGSEQFINAYKKKSKVSCS